MRATIFRPKRGRQRNFVATLGDVVNSRGELLDEALCTAFPHGKSYTGEASFELSLHGNPVIARAVLNALRELGCRLAEPGEMTLRAVLTGRIDLTAAEAVDDVVCARTDAAARAAVRALKGGLREQIEPVREILVDVLAEIEARLDFPDEPLGDANTAELIRKLASARERTAHLLAGADRGAKLRDGARVVLYGPPNAGKSTLLNALVGRERALVHDEPGTTRDVLEAEIEINGIAVTLVDVAGIRSLEHAGAVERMGIERAQQERDRADVVLALVPAQEHVEIDGDVLVQTKADLGVRERRGIVISAKTGEGLDDLRREIASRLGDANDEEALLMRERQVQCVREADDAIGAVRLDEPGEVIASELRRAARALDRMLGRDISDDVLNTIFSRFCIGK